MEPCEFSETQFSFCFTFEYIKQFLPTIPLPIFPNTVVEGRAGGGYDVEIRGNIFFQFKIPTYHNSVSNFHRTFWNVFGSEYLKIKLETDKNQFKLLKDLKNSTTQVFYATPNFYKIEKLRTHYISDNIVSNSSLFLVIVSNRKFSRT